jgi:hypothetical protein
MFRERPVISNIRELGVQRLIASWLNDACRHTALIDCRANPAETPVPSYGRRAACGKCRCKRVDARPQRDWVLVAVSVK